MPSASNGPLQATGPRPSPSRDRKVQPVGPSRLARTCAKGVCDGTSRPSTTATATLPAERDRERPGRPADRRRPSPSGGSPPHVGQGTRVPAPRRRAAALLWSSAGKPLPASVTWCPRTQDSGRRVGLLSPRVDDGLATWLILPVVICLSQRLSHACLSTGLSKAKPRMAH